MVGIKQSLAMTEGTDTVLSRREYLQTLEAFCQALQEALGRAGVVSDEALEVWRTCLTAHCLQCGIEITGEELFALSQPPSAERSSSKIGQLRLGYCACKSCKSCYYEVNFQTCSTLDWPVLLAQVESQQRSQPRQVLERTRFMSTTGVLLHWPAVQRLSLVLISFLLFLLARQWMIGGRIPWLREPQRFFANPDQTSFSTNSTHE
jgi:hypothetical protein